MGWNGSGKECVAVRPTKATMSSTIRASAVKWMIAVLVCFAVCVAAVFVYSVQGNDAKKPKSGKSGGMIAEAKPAIGMRANAVSVRKIEHPKTVDEALTNIAEPQKAVIKQRELTPQEWNRITNRTYATCTEQVMSWIFTKQLGDVPLPVPPISDEDRDNLISILLSKNEIKATDGEMTAFSKESVDVAKQEMRKYIADGGDPDEFLQYYGRQLKDAYEYRRQIETEAGEIIEDGDLELARAFIKKANELLDERGIKPIYATQYAALKDIPDDSTAERQDRGEEL